MAKFYPYLLLVLAFIFGTNLGHANVVVTPAAAVTNVCVSPTSYSTLGTIYIAEVANTDFADGGGRVYTLTLPAGFEFNTGVTPTVTKKGTGVFLGTISAPTSTSFTFQYTVVGSAGQKDSILISNIQVKALTASATGNIVLGASSSTGMLGNELADLQNHCTLTASELSIATNLVNISACEGSSPSFTITTTGSGITYDWERDNITDGDPFEVPPAGYTVNQNMLTADNCMLGQNGFLFRCLVSKNGCSIMSSVATLSVGAAAQVTGQPSNDAACPGGNADFSVSGNNIANYQWQENSGSGFNNLSNNATYSGVTTANLTINGVIAGMHNRSYRCVVSGSICTTPVNSNAATLSVTTPAAVTNHPSDQVGCGGDNVTFTVVGSNANTYQWQVNSGSGFTNLSNGSGYSNVTTASMTFNGITVGMNGWDYRCVLSHSSCSTPATSNAANLSVNPPPVITAHPIDKIACTSTQVTFTVTATGHNLSYQWKRDNGDGYANPPGSFYSGTTASNVPTSTLTAGLTGGGVQTSNNGFKFKVEVTSCGTTITSNEALLTVYSSSTVNFSGLDGSYCRNGVADTIQGIPAGGVFSGPGITPGTTNLSTGKVAFQPNQASGTGSKTITYNLGCAITHNTTINDTTNIAYTSPANAAPTYTTGDPSVNLVVQAAPTPAGALPGTFTGTGVSGSTFIPNVAGVGTHTINFTYTNSNGCVSKVKKVVSVTDGAGKNIPKLLASSPYCQNGSAPVYLGINDVSDTEFIINNGYSWFYEGPGITYAADSSKYKFTPTMIGGSYEIKFRYTYYLFGIFPITVDYAKQTVTIKGQTSLSLDGLPGEVCNTNAPFDMVPAPGVVTGTGGPAGTNISIISPVSAPAGVLTGSSSNIFNPSVANSGLFTVRYHYTNADGCVTNFDKTVDVNPKPSAPVLITTGNNAGLDEKYCFKKSGELDPRKNYTLPNILGTTYNWYDNQALTLPTISTGHILTPQLQDTLPGVYHYYVTRTISGCTSNPREITMTINDAASISTGSSQIVCSGNTVTLAGVSTKLISGVALGGTWSSSTGGTFNDANNLAAVYTPSSADITTQSVNLTLTSTDPDGAGPCPAVTGQVKINITPAATVDAGPPQTYCSNSPITLTGSYGGSAGTIAWTGGSPGGLITPALSTTQYNPTNLEKSGGTIIFTATTNDPDGLSGPCLAVSDQVSITINQEATVSAGVDQSICRSSGTTVINLNGLSTYKYTTATPVNATWTGGAGGFSSATSATSTYSANVSEIPANGMAPKLVKLYLTTIDPDGAGGPCKAEKDSVEISINSLPLIDPIVGLKPEFCTSDAPIALIYAPVTTPSEKQTDLFEDVPGPGETLGSNPFLPGMSGTAFFPNNASPISHRVRYTFTDKKGCSNFRDTIIRVYGVPRPKIDIAKYCATELTYFDTSSTSLPALDVVSKMNEFTWNFGDFATEFDQSPWTFTSYIYPKTLNLSAIQNYTVRLTVKTDKGCVGIKDTSIIIGNIPETDYKWSHICPSDPHTSFVDISGFPSNEVSQYTWNFNDGGPAAIASGPGMNGAVPNWALRNPDHKMYNGTGAYNVSYTISSVRGCTLTKSHKVNILPQYKPTPTDPYSLNFSATDGHWAADGNNVSWQWGTSDKPLINTGSRNVWITDTTDTYNVNENSNLNGPCLNFTKLSKPMIAMKIRTETENKFAGAVLQSSVDGGSTWNLVGQLGDGINWYDNFGISGNPGGQSISQFGWTGFYNGWKVAKISLQNLSGQTSVRFRVAFASGADNLNLKDGFAIDSVWVGERDKVLLLENFTSSNSAAATTADAALNALVDSRASDLVAIHYHTSFPGGDPMNLRNQADPSARVLQYGVPSVPFKVMDGNYNFGATLEAADIDKRALETAKFKIKLTTTSATNSISANVNITATENVTNDILVHVVVVERYDTVGGNPYQWVMTKMLPDAAGTYFNQNFNKNDQVNFTETWSYTSAQVYKPAQLGVIVFIQDLNSNEIFQTAYVLGDGNNYTTSLKNSLLAGKEIFLYPNPANSEVNVLFEESFDEDIHYQVYDQLGKVVANGMIEKGSKDVTFNTSDFASGLYVVRIGSDKNGFAYKKVVIEH